jgi:hypothetical protein
MRQPLEPLTRATMNCGVVASVPMTSPALSESVPETLPPSVLSMPMVCSLCPSPARAVGYSEMYPLAAPSLVLTLLAPVKSSFWWELLGRVESPGVPPVAPVPEGVCASKKTPEVSSRVSLIAMAIGHLLYGACRPGTCGSWHKGERLSPHPGTQSGSCVS